MSLERSRVNLQPTTNNLQWTDTSTEQRIRKSRGSVSNRWYYKNSFPNFTKLDTQPILKVDICVQQIPKPDPITSRAQLCTFHLTYFENQIPHQSSIFALLSSVRLLSSSRLCRPPATNSSLTYLSDSRTWFFEPSSCSFVLPPHTAVWRANNCSNIKFISRRRNECVEDCS